MVLQSSGAISLSNVKSEFGTTFNTLSNCYGIATGVPVSGQITLSNFWGKGATIPSINALSTSNISTHTSAQSGTITLHSLITDAYGAPFTYSIPTPSTGFSSASMTGSNLSYSIAGNTFTSNASVSVTVTNRFGRTAVISYPFKITGSNIATTSMGSVTLSNNTTSYAMTNYFTDYSGSGLGYAFSLNPNANAYFSGSTMYVPGNYRNTTYNVTVQASNAHGQTATSTLAVTETAQPNTNVIGLVGSSGMTQIVSATADDAYIKITIPFTFYYNGVNYGNDANGGVYVVSNSYISFGGSATAFSGLGASNPPLPTMFIGGQDCSYQQVFVTTQNGGTQYRVRFEGTAGTTGTVGSPNIVWEVVFFNDSSIQLNTGTMSNSGGLAIFTNGTGTTLLTYPLSANSQYRFLTKYYCIYGTLTQSTISMTVIVSATADDASIKITIPFSFKIKGVDYGNDQNGGVYVCSNSYITFGGSATPYSSLSASNPAFKTLFLGAADNSYQWIVVGGTSSMYRVRYEGTAATSGTVGSSNIFWVVEFYNNHTMIIYFGTHARPDGVFMLSDGTGGIILPFALKENSSISISNLNA